MVLSSRGERGRRDVDLVVGAAGACYAAVPAVLWWTGSATHAPVGQPASGLLAVLAAAVVLTGLAVRAAVGRVRRGPARVVGIGLMLVAAGELAAMWTALSAGVGGLVPVFLAASAFIGWFAYRLFAAVERRHAATAGRRDLP
jgi:hypothetical protein